MRGAVYRRPDGSRISTFHQALGRWRLPVSGSLLGWILILCVHRYSISRTSLVTAAIVFGTSLPPPPPIVQPDGAGS